MKELFYFDKQGYESEVSRLEYSARLHWLPILRDWVKMGLPKTLGNTDFVRVARDTAGIVLELLTKGQELRLFGLRLKAAQALEVVEMPEPFEPMLAKIKAAITDPVHQVSPELLEVVNGQIQLTEAAKERLNEGFSRYLTNEKQRQILEAANELAAAFNKLQQLAWRGYTTSDPRSLIAQQALRRQGNNYGKPLEVNPDFIIRQGLV